MVQPILVPICAGSGPVSLQEENEKASHLAQEAIKAVLLYHFVS